jgi:hypothetical protein
MAKKKKKSKTARSKAKESKALVSKELTEEEKVRMTAPNQSYEAVSQELFVQH